ncbi:MAG: hypothetical protein R6U84_06045 [Candidatus Cloacimonadales bacterium]
MKRFMVLLIATFAILSLSLVGCSEDEKDNGSSTGPEIDPEDYGYYFAISKSMFADSQTKDDEYMVVLNNFEASNIQTAELKIDNEVIELIPWQGSWGGYVSLSADHEEHDFELSIDGSNYHFGLSKAIMPEVDWPENYVMADGMQLDWQLNPSIDSDLQQVTGIGHAEVGNNENKQEFVDSDARTFMIPNNWFDEDYPEYSFTVDQINYLVEDDLLAMSIEIDPHDYGSGNKSYSADEKIRELIHKLQYR